MMLTNKEAIEMIASMGKYLTDGNPIWKTEPIKEATNMAMSALRQTAWILVGERLPDDFEHVLVTLGNGYDGVTYDWRSDGDWYDWGKSVIAWMPLPKPYKGGVRIMLINNGIIVSATETELYSYWLPRYSDIMSFPDFLKEFKGNGGIVVEEGGDNND